MWQRDVWALLDLRVRLLLRQRLGWMSIIVGIALVLLSLVIARVSFVNPVKIFWDFSLGIIFVLQVLLALYLSTQVYNDDRHRRTLHLVLSSGASRAAWVVGTSLGLWISLLIMNVLWFGVTALMAVLNFESVNLLMPFQAMVALAFEVLILCFMGVFIAMFVRPVLALMLAVMATCLLHSLTGLQRVFTDPQVGRYIDEGPSVWVIWLARLLPPLEWFDLKTFVGYQEQVSWLLMGQLSLLAVLWAAVLATGAWLRFERMDL